MVVNKFRQGDEVRRQLSQRQQISFYILMTVILNGRGVQNAMGLLQVARRRRQCGWLAVIVAR